jgi:hypothetical protein
MENQYQLVFHLLRDRAYPAGWNGHQTNRRRSTMSRPVNTTAPVDAMIYGCSFSYHVMQRSVFGRIVEFGIVQFDPGHCGSHAYTPDGMPSPFIIVAYRKAR